MAGIFKAYDIRGIYGKDLTEEVAYKIGRALVTFTGCKKAAVARDIRLGHVSAEAARRDYGVRIAEDGSLSR